MKNTAILAVALVVVGCGETADGAEEVAVEEETQATGFAITPGLYAVGDETTEYVRTRLNEDGTYVDMSEDAVVGQGTWTAEGATMCMDPEGDGEDEQERCWSNSEPDEDGSFMTTRDDDSQSYLVTPISE